MSFYEAADQLESTLRERHYAHAPRAEALQDEAQDQWLLGLAFRSLMKAANGDHLSALEGLLVTAVERSGMSAAMIGILLQEKLPADLQDTIFQTASVPDENSLFEPFYTIMPSRNMPLIRARWSEAACTLTIEGVEQRNSSPAAKHEQARVSGKRRLYLGEQAEAINAIEAVTCFSLLKQRLTIELITSAELGANTTPYPLPPALLVAIKTIRFKCEQEMAWNWVEASDDSPFFYCT